ncbi:nitroreductase family protein [Sporomusa termitida]|uniref:NADH dehydrogenase n=1 Tax=Sporomusa termitida TaxID=2377 RepID=A0A517DZ32_9FIRM|nr:nitroreductase family protein [Sporomusa termitida]QDR82578.1 NADH dehydrogenase [Sporomusa termitida]
MELSAAIANRRSIRKFKPDQVSDDDIKAILAAARLAPSGSNLQPSRYVVIKSPEAKARLAEYTLPFVTKAPVIIVCCTDSQVWSTALARWTELQAAGAFSDNPLDVEKILEYKQRNPLDPETAKAYAWLNAAIAIDHMTLTAFDLGLGSCWIGILDRQKIKTMLELDDRYDVVALLPVGYPDQQPAARPRLAMSELLLKEL